MPGIISKLKSATRNTTTYRVGLLQAKAYRVLKQKTSDALFEFGISTIEWAFIGLLSDVKEGLRPLELAEELGVEAPFVTVLSGKLLKKKLIETEPDPDDNRSKIIKLSGEGKKFLLTTEKIIRDKMRPLIKDVALTDLVSYLSVLEKMIENSD